MPDRNHADEWLPSRFSLGTLRLIAYSISRALERRRPSSGAYLNRESQQHPLEATLLSMAYWIIPTTQLALLTVSEAGWRWLAAPLVFVALLMIVPVLWILVSLIFSPIASRVSRATGKPTHDIQALVTPTVMFGLAVASVLRHWPGALLGWFWIALTLIEIVATLACFLLRGRFAALDERLPSEAP